MVAAGAVARGRQGLRLRRILFVTPARRPRYLVRVTTTRTHLLLPALALALAACGNSKADSTVEAKGESKAAAPVGPAAVPCTAEAIEALAKGLHVGSGFGMDRSKEAATIEAQKQALLGKSFAFTGCTFRRQGNDQITFAAVDTQSEIACTMKGGEAAVRAFVGGATSSEPDKLRLDVRGTVTLDKGDYGPEFLALTGCEITVQR